MSNLKLAVINFVLSIFLTLNIFIFHSHILGTIFGLGFIGLSSWLIEVLMKTRPNIEKIFFGFLTFLSITIIILSTVYYFYKLDNFVISGFIILLSLTLLVTTKKQSSNPPFKWWVNPGGWWVNQNQNSYYIFISLYLFLLILSFFVLKQGQTMEPVRTPWHFVSIWFFIVYFLSTIFLIILAWVLKPGLTLILTSLHLFFTFSIANIIFPLGFGYDSFIHQATEKYILEHGFILPKPFYYLGQYSLITFLTKISNLSHIIIDKHLVPFLASVLLPVTIYLTFIKLKFPERIAKILPFTFLFIPFSVFTFTTPQNLADLLVIIIAFLGLSHLLNKKPSIYFLSLFTLATLIIHPLAGLASLIFISIILLKKIRIKKVLYFFISLFLYFFFFFIFIIFSLFSPFYKITLNNNFNITNFVNNLFGQSPNLFLNTNFVHIIKTIAYFIYDPKKIFLIIFLLSLAGLYYLKKHKQNNSMITAHSLPITFIILVINSLIVFSFINFDFLVDYEQGDFSQRIFNLGVYFLIPLALIAVMYLLEKIFKLSWVLKPGLMKEVLKPSLTFAFAIILTISLYFSCPRHDIYYYTRGFNTSIYDFNTVNYLDKISAKDYVVLSNQQVGAAALTTFGFRYYDNKHFFYSIPTGGDLYKIYLKMVYQKPSYENALLAMELTGVDIVYLYVNDYWINFRYLVPRAKKLADQTLVLENGKVWVFKYIKK